VTALGISIVRMYGSTEHPSITGSTHDDPLEKRAGTDGHPLDGCEIRLAADGEIESRGPDCFAGYTDPELTAKVFDADGWYRTGDIGRFDPDGRLILMGRNKDIIVLPNGFNVYPEDIENALRVAGIRDSVVLETRPGRIEAIVLAPGSHGLPQGGDVPAPRSSEATPDSAAVSAAIDASVRTANQTLAVHQRVAAWRLWPDADFPRTHTLKVKRDLVRAWASVDEPLPVRQGS
jgi:long-subunit acyl-CoA synthetase (AMP-forming)